MLIRPAREGDAAALTALEAVCFPADPWPERFFAAALGRTLVAEEAGEVVGYAVLSYVMDEGSLDNIAVAPDHRRQGVADALLEGLVRLARERALAFVTLEVRASNGPAAALYKKHGFAQVGRRTNYYERPREDAILMTLVIV